jgi:hypothetical protein
MAAVFAIAIVKDDLASKDASAVEELNKVNDFLFKRHR